MILIISITIQSCGMWWFLIEPQPEQDSDYEDSKKPLPPSRVRYPNQDQKACTSSKKVQQKLEKLIKDIEKIENTVNRDFNFNLASTQCVAYRYRVIDFYKLSKYSTKAYKIANKLCKQLVKISRENREPLFPTSSAPTTPDSSAKTQLALTQFLEALESADQEARQTLDKVEKEIEDNCDKSE